MKGLRTSTTGGEKKLADCTTMIWGRQGGGGGGLRKVIDWEGVYALWLEGGGNFWKSGEQPWRKISLIWEEFEQGTYILLPEGGN